MLYDFPYVIIPQGDAAATSATPEKKHYFFFTQGLVNIGIKF